MIPLANCGKVKSYIGMDVNEGMLYHARKKARTLRSNESITTDVTTLAGSLLEDLPFGDNVFDVVLLNQVYCHIFVYVFLSESTQRKREIVNNQFMMKFITELVLLLLLL